MTANIVYKPTQKGLSKSGEMEPTDRYLFTGPKSALIYNASTFEIIEPFGYKSKDCYVEETSEAVPTELFMCPAIRRMYKLEKILAVGKVLGILFTASSTPVKL